MLAAQMPRVQGSFSLVKRWLPALIWMVVIFSASTGTMSSSNTSRIIRPVLLWLNPDLSEETISRSIFLIRKTAHVVEYAILGTLCWLGCGRTPASQPRPWSWRRAALAFGIAVAYAFTDEFHQHFVPSRQGQIADVLLDASGAAAGILLVWAAGRWRRVW